MATVVLWHALVAEHQSAQKARLALVAENLSEDIFTHIDGPIRALDRMKKRWLRRGGTPRDEWIADASAYLRDEKMLTAVEWVDASGHLQWIVSDDRTESLQGLDVRSDCRWDAAGRLAEAQESGEKMLSPTFPLRQGGMGFLAYLPLVASGRFDGFLVGVFRMEQLMAEAVNESRTSGLQISVFQDETRIYGPESEAGPSRPRGEALVEFYGHQWKLVIVPSEELLIASRNKLPNLILVFGTLLTIATSAGIRAWQQVRQNTRQIEQANRILEGEVRKRRRIESKLRLSEEFLRDVLNSATGVSVIAADEAGQVTYFSRGSETLLGYFADEIIGRTTPVLFHDEKEVAERGRELSEELDRTVEGFEIFVAVPKREGHELREWTYVCKNGDRKTVELNVTLQKNDQGRVIGFLGTAIDISERKRMERELRETLRAMNSARSLLESAGRIARLGHWELKLDGSGPKWSEVTYAIHQVEPGTPVSLEEAFAFYHEDDREMIRKHIARAVESGERFEFESRVVTAKGQEIWVRCQGERLLDDLGTAAAVQGVVQDVTDQHNAAALLSDRNRQLEELNREAMAYAKAKADFLANMSHEIRTPLNAIIGISDLLRDFVTEDLHRELVETIHVSGDVLLTLVNDILDFSKIESGRMELERIPVDLHACVESALNIVSAFAGKKRIDLLYWIDPRVPAFVLGDVTRLRQILVNLVTNGVKFTEIGEVFVRIDLADWENGGKGLRISVRDTGIGIPVAEQHRLFQAFSQVEASTSRRFGGTGLGLAICQRLVELMCGRIGVESQPGMGSEFFLEIPLEPADVETPDIYVNGGTRIWQACASSWSTTTPRTAGFCRISLAAGELNCRRPAVLLRPCAGWRTEGGLIFSSSMAGCRKSTAANLPQVCVSRMIIGALRF